MTDPRSVRATVKAAKANAESARDRWPDGAGGTTAIEQAIELLATAEEILDACVEADRTSGPGFPD